jgi:hypothetical protein
MSYQLQQEIVPIFTKQLYYGAAFALPSFVVGDSAKLMISESTSISAYLEAFSSVHL